ncbi:MAG TPA: hypothetical protein VHC19_18620 [Pirellulales bacterium]|jgi:hypothetical protein|nr:hypothetical protein [Pirellulales bacterium]
MSLKAFHLLFIAASELLLLGFAGYENFRYWQLAGSRADLWIGFASSLIGFVLLVYVWFFLRKTKDIGLV